MEDIILDLQYTLIRKFINTNMQNYDYALYEDLFAYIAKSIKTLSPALSFDITYSKISNEYIHIIILINAPNSLGNKLSILFDINDFIINEIDVSLIH